MGSQFKLGEAVQLAEGETWFKFDHGHVVGFGTVDPGHFYVALDGMPYPVVIVQQDDTGMLDVWPLESVKPCPDAATL